MSSNNHYKFLLLSLCCFLLIPLTCIATSYNEKVFAISCYSSLDEKQLDIQLKDNREEIEKLLEPIVYYFNNEPPYMNLNGFKGLYRINTYKNNSFEYMVKDIMNRNGIENIFYRDVEKIIKSYSKEFNKPSYLAGAAFEWSLEHNANKWEVFNRQFWRKDYELGKITSVQCDAEKILTYFDNKDKLNTFENDANNINNYIENWRRSRDFLSVRRTFDGLQTFAVL